ncbi:MAG: glycosyltransferase family 2 protein [Stygiobacter sp.]
MDVSIVIINYNSTDYLLKCLDSIFRFTKEISFEVIIVDNASKVFDEKYILSKYHGIRIIKNEQNVGFAKANNQGFNLANGKYTLFLNNDTILIENTIKNVFDFAEKYNHDVFVGCQLLNSDYSKQESVVEFPNVWNGFTENFFLYKIFPQSKIFNKYYQNEIELTNPTEVDVIKGAFMFCSSESIRKLNGFDERFFFYSEETDLCFRFKKNGGEIYFLPKEKLIHFGGVSTDNSLWFKFKNQTIGKIQFYQKHFNGFRFIAVLVIHFCGLFLRGILFSIIGLLTFNKSVFLKGFYFFKQLFVYPKNLFCES